MRTPTIVHGAAALALAVAAFGPPAVKAQADADGPFHDGRWTATIGSSEAGYRTARVLIANFGGTWQDTTPSRHVRNKACAGKTFQITVQRSRTTDIEMMVWGSSTLPSCPDLQVLLKPVDDKTLSGTIGNEGRLRLVRR